MTTRNARVPATRREEAKCPECERWHAVAWDDSLPPGGFWWAYGSAGCPSCGALICVESECEFREAQPIVIAPTTRDEANACVELWHSHNDPVRSHRFACAALVAGAVVGVVIVGNPIAAEFQKVATIFEVLRLADQAGAPLHVASRLLGAARRAALEMGYRRGVSYTRIDEPGTCYRASGWWPTARVEGREWNTGNKATRWLPGIAPQTHEVVDRVRWETGPDAAPELPELAHLGRRKEPAHAA